MPMSRREAIQYFSHLAAQARRRADAAREAGDEKAADHWLAKALNYDARRREAETQS